MKPACVSRLSRRNLRPLAFVGLAMATLTLAPLLPAQTYVDYQTSLSIGIDTFEQTAHEGGEAVGPISSRIDQPGYGWANAVANVAPGANKAGFDVHGTDAGNPLTYGRAFASSMYYDSFTIDDPALTGTVGTFTTTLFVHGSGDFRIDESIATSSETMMSALWNAVINVTSQGLADEDGLQVYQSAYYAGEWFKDFEETGLPYYGDPLGEYQQEATFEFIYGQPVDLQTFLQTSLIYDNQALVPGTFDVNVDLSHSAYWGGLREVRDASGNLVSDYGFASQSGFDYRLDATPSAVPEPASLAAITLGVGALLRRRKKTS